MSFGVVFPQAPSPSLLIQVDPQVFVGIAEGISGEFSVNPNLLRCFACAWTCLSAIAHINADQANQLVAVHPPDPIGCQATSIPSRSMKKKKEGSLAACRHAWNTTSQHQAAASSGRRLLRIPSIALA